MDSDLSINEIIARCRHYWWLAIVLGLSGLLAGILVARMPRYQSVITVWSMPVVVRNQPVSRLDAGYSEALYASMLTFLQGEWQANMGGKDVAVTVRLNRQTYQLMSEGSLFGFDEAAARTFDRFSAWMAGETITGGLEEVDSNDCFADVDTDSLGLCLIEGHDQSQEEAVTIAPVNSLSELVWVGELSGPEVTQKYPGIRWIAPLVTLVIGLLTFFCVILVDVSCEKPGKPQ